MKLELLNSGALSIELDNNTNGVIYPNNNPNTNARGEILKHYPTEQRLICEISKQTPAGCMDAVFYGDNHESLIDNAVDWSAVMDKKYRIIN